MTQETPQAPTVPLSDQETIEFIARAMQRMAEYTFPYVASVLRVEDDDTGTFCGSAWRVLLMGRRAVVTAAHVINEAASLGRMVAVSAERGSRPHEAPSDQWTLSPTDDLAVWYAPDAYAKGVSADQVAFWRADAIDSSGDRIGTDFLFVHGFPQVRGHFSPNLGGMLNTSFPYGAMQREEPMASVSLAPDEFALHFEVEGLLSSGGGEAAFTRPHGLSGSAVWRLDVGGRSASSWTPQAAKLVGVVSRWVPNEQALIVVHASRVLALGRPV